MNNQNLEITGKLLARNTFLNLIGQGLPLLVAVLTIPYIIKRLGPERFGIFSIALVILGYIGFFDLGLGRATTKFVAEALGRGENERIRAIFWTSLTSQLLLGILGGIILVLATPVLIKRILNIPLDLIEEAKNTFYLLSFSIPVVICSASLRGVLEAAQRFDLVNAVKIPYTSLIFLLPVIGLLLGFQLPGIVFLLIMAMVGTIVVYFALCFHIYPTIKQLSLIDSTIFRSLLVFGGWVTICNFLIPILAYLDRFLIGALLSITAVGYYSVSYDVLSRLGAFPRSFGMALFPAFSTLGVDEEKLKRLYARSLKFLLLTMGPIVLIIVIFAGDILRLWLGSDYASKTTLVFQILAIGILINALSQMPANLLDGIGRPDLRAKIFLSYVGIYIGLLWILITKFGIVGAALAWALRAGLELGLFFGVTWRLLRFSPAILVESGFVKGLIAFGCLAAITPGITSAVGKPIWIQGTATVSCLTLFALVIWRYVLDQADKSRLKAIFTQFSDNKKDAQ